MGHGRGVDGSGSETAIHSSLPVSFDPEHVHQQAEQDGGEKIEASSMKIDEEREGSRLR